MPILQVADDPQSPGLFYLDSGAPDSSATYTTIFLIHGHTFHSPIFERLLPLAPQYNLRIVPVTRRDYPGSTPFSAAELELIKNGDAHVKLEFLKERAQELALFIDRFIQLNSVPKTAANGSGGVGIAGWSLGNLLGLSLVAFARYFPKELVESLDPYIKTLILYECPYHILGFPIPPKAYHPLKDPTISPQDKATVFSAWVSGYFKHPGLAARDLEDGLEYVKPSAHRAATDTRFSDNDKARTMDHTPGSRSEDPFFISVPQIMSQLRDDVFFPDVAEWPKVTVKLAWAEEGVWSTAYGYWALEEYMAEITASSPDCWHRPLEKAVSIPGANHFAHWDDPEILLQVFADFAL